MSIKKGKKQVYKVNDKVQSKISEDIKIADIRTGDRGFVRSVDDKDIEVYFYRTHEAYYMKSQEIEPSSPLKPKKSIKKMLNIWNIGKNKYWCPHFEIKVLEKIKLNKFSCPKCGTIAWLDC